MSDFSVVYFVSIFDFSTFITIISNYGSCHNSTPNNKNYTCLLVLKKCKISQEDIFGRDATDRLHFHHRENDRFYFFFSHHTCCSLSGHTVEEKGIERQPRRRERKRYDSRGEERNDVSRNISSYRIGIVGIHTRARGYVSAAV